MSSMPNDVILAAAKILKDPKSTKAQRTVAASALTGRSLAAEELRRTLDRERIKDILRGLDDLYVLLGKVNGRTAKDTSRMHGALDRIVRMKIVAERVVFPEKTP